MSQEPVLFYEREFYVLSNFSSFMVEYDGYVFPTSEHVYHYRKFEARYGSPPFGSDVLQAQQEVKFSRSAHDAQKIAKSHKALWRPDWDGVKIGIMEEILWLKVEQHEYVKRKLLETGDREIIEDSWRDDFWGWGENKDGQNHLGKLWMKIREKLKEAE